MSKRYTVMPHLDVGGYLRYLVIDTATGRSVGEQDCLPWAERKAAELNERKEVSEKDTTMRSKHEKRATRHE